MFTLMVLLGTPLSQSKENGEEYFRGTFLTTPEPSAFPTSRVTESSLHHTGWRSKSSIEWGQSIEIERICRRQELLVPPGGTVTRCQCFEKQYRGSSKKCKTPTTIWSRDSKHKPTKVENRVLKNICTSLFLAALLTINKRKQVKNPLMDEWTNKIWFVGPE